MSRADTSLRRHGREEESEKRRALEEEKRRGKTKRRKSEKSEEEEGRARGSATILISKIAMLSPHYRAF